MKKTIVTAMCIAASVASLSAATNILASNAAGPGTFQIQDNLGNPLVGGSYQVGVFSNPGDVSDLGTFTSAGSSAFSASAFAPGIFGAFGSGGISVDISNDGQPAGPFVGQPIFVVIEGGPGGEFIVFSTGGATFAQETALDVGPDISIPAGALTLERGVQLAPGSNTGLGGPLASGNAGSAITFVPEPSVSLLAGLAGLCLLRRKR